MKLKYKFLGTLLFFLILLFGYSIKCNAFTFEGKSGTIDVPLEDIEEYQNGLDFFIFWSTSPARYNIYFIYGSVCKVTASGFAVSGDYRPCYYSSSGEFTSDGVTTSNLNWKVYYSSLYYSSFDICDDDGNIFYSKTGLDTPYITNTTEVLSTGNFDYLCINSADFVGDNWQDFYLLTYDYTTNKEDVEAIYPRKIIEISGGNSSKYYSNTYDGSYIFMIPLADLGIKYMNDYNYGFKLATQGYKDGYTYYDYFYDIKFSVSGLTAEQQLQQSQDMTNSQLNEQSEILEQQNQKLDEQKQAIEENTEVNKNIFEKIGDILSYINPFSENFFAYKLVELIVDGLKSLFIPEDGFISSFFDDLKSWFSDRLGFLFYPFELIIDILNKIIDINFTEPIFNIPDISEPFTGTKLISATSFNLNSMLDNSIFKNVHNIYLLCVDAFIIFGLVNLAKRKFEEVTMK